MTNYVFKHSDPAAGSFLVQADQIDGTSRPGNAALYTNSVSGLTAIASSSSLVLAGQGIVDYGELVQNNMIYLMEHFAFATRPLTPVQGQIWYKNTAINDPSYPDDPTTIGLYLFDGTIWTPIITGAGGVLDMGGARVAHVGDATDAGDAVSRGYGDVRYLQIAGGNTTGVITASSGSWVFGAGVPVSVTAAPTTGLNVTNKTYVDGVINTESTARTNEDISLQNQITTLSGELGTFVVSTGDTYTGTLAFDPNAALTFGTGSGTISFGLRRLQQVADPIANSDAATRLYVDTAIGTAVAGIGSGGSSTADGVVSAGSFDGSTGTLTLNRTQGLPDVIITGNMAPFVHSQDASTVTVNLSTPYSRSYFATSDSSDSGYPANTRLDLLLTSIDQALNDVTRRVERQLIVADGTTTTYALTANMAYDVDNNRLQVFNQGVKQYANEHGSSKIVFTATNIGYLTVVTGFNAAPRSATLTVDGGVGDVITIQPTSGYTYLQMFSDIQTAITAGSVPVFMRITQFDGRIELEFVSNTSGSGSSVTTSADAGELFAVVATASAPVNKAVTVSYSYAEVGNVGTSSTSVTFTTAPVSGAVLEFLVSQR